MERNETPCRACTRRLRCPDRTFYEEYAERVERAALPEYIELAMACKRYCEALPVRVVHTVAAEDFPLP